VIANLTVVVSVDRTIKEVFTSLTNFIFKSSERAYGICVSDFHETRLECGKALLFWVHKIVCYLLY